MSKKVLLVGSMASMIMNFNLDNILILQKLGYEVDVVANFGIEDPISEKKRKNFLKFLKDNNIKYFDVAFPRGIGGIGKNINILIKLNQIISNNHYEFIHTNSPLASVLVRLVAKYNKVPVIYTVHGFQFYSGGPKKDWVVFYTIEKLLVKATSAIITINAEDYKRAKDMGFQKVFLIPGVGIDSSKICGKVHAPSLSKKSRFVIISVGELNDNKNQRCVLEAIKNSKNRNKIVYVICGIGINQDEYKNYVKRNDLEENIIFAGYQDNVFELLNMSDIFVFPSYREGLSVSVMEAMAAGKPVFASKIRGNVDLIDEEKGGFLFNPHDPNSLTSLLDTYLTDSYRLKQMGEYNQRKAHLYTKDVVNYKMKEIYQETIKDIQSKT